MVFAPQPKHRPSMLDKQDRRKALQSADEAENQKVRARSKGQCEIREVVRAGFAMAVPCAHRACQIHHMIGGWGKRARGKSTLAEHKQHCCATCHREITGHVLKRIGGVTPLWTDTYERVQ